MGGGECFHSAPFRTGLSASRGESDPGHSALQRLPGTVAGAWQPAGFRVQFCGTWRALIVLSLNVQLSLALSYPRRCRRLPQSHSARAPSSAGPPGVGAAPPCGLAHEGTWTPGMSPCGAEPAQSPRVRFFGRLEEMPDTYLHGQCIKCVSCGWVGGGV